MLFAGGPDGPNALAAFKPPAVFVDGSKTEVVPLNELPIATAGSNAPSPKLAAMLPALAPPRPLPCKAAPTAALSIPGFVNAPII